MDDRNIKADEDRAAAVAVAPRVTKEQIEANIAAISYATGRQAFDIEENDFLPPSLGLSTICCITMLNGFNVWGHSACVSPENFNAELGKQIAYENAFRKLWELEAYLLAERGKARHIEQIARICHEVNRVYCDSQGDYTQPFWADAPEWQRNSAMEGVLFHIQNPGAGPSASHDNWLKAKEYDGWIYGEVKDPDAKVHPCMVPFDELPREQRYKDKLFIAIVHAALGRDANPQAKLDLGGTVREDDSPTVKAALGVLDEAFAAGEKAAPNSTTGGQQFDADAEKVEQDAGKAHLAMQAKLDSGSGLYADEDISPLAMRDGESLADYKIRTDAASKL